MGMGAVDYAIHADRKPSLLVVTDIDRERLQRASEIITEKKPNATGLRLYI